MINFQLLEALGFGHGFLLDACVVGQDHLNIFICIFFDFFFILFYVEDESQDIHSLRWVLCRSYGIRGFEDYRDGLYNDKVRIEGRDYV